MGLSFHDESSLVEVSLEIAADVPEMGGINQDLCIEHHDSNSIPEIL